MTWPNDYQHWFDLHAELRETAIKIVSSVNVRHTENGLNDPAIYGATLLFRTLQSCRVTFSLAEAGELVEANIIARSCIENVLWMRGLQQRGLSFVQEILGDGMKAEAALAELLVKMPGVNLDKESSKIAAEQMNWRNNRSVKVGAISDSQEASRDYAIFRIISNNYAHPSLRSLDCHVVRDRASGPYTLAMEPEVSPRDLLWTMFIAAGATLSAVGLFLEIISADDRAHGAALQSIADRFREFGERVGFAGSDEQPGADP